MWIFRGQPLQRDSKASARVIGEHVLYMFRKLQFLCAWKEKRGLFLRMVGDEVREVAQ